MQYVVVHKDDIERLRILRSHFQYDKVKGIVEIGAIKGWKLIHSHSESPVEFLIYEVEGVTHSNKLGGGGRTPPRPHNTRLT